MAPQVTSITIVHSTVYWGSDQRKHQSSASQAFVRRIHRWPVNSPHKGPVTRKMFPFDDVIIQMWCWKQLIIGIGQKADWLRELGLSMLHWHLIAINCRNTCATQCLLLKCKIVQLLANNESVQLDDVRQIIAQSIWSLRLVISYQLYSMRCDPNRINWKTLPTSNTNLQPLCYLCNSHNFKLWTTRWNLCCYTVKTGWFLCFNSWKILIWSCWIFGSWKNDALHHWVLFLLALSMKINQYFAIVFYTPRHHNLYYGQYMVCGLFSEKGDEI